MGDDIMEGDSIRRIKQVEEEAEDLIDDAADETHRVESQSKQEYSVRILSAQERARKTSEGIRDQLLKEADEEVRAIRKDAEHKRGILNLQSGSQTGDAVRVVLQTLEGFGRDTESDDRAD
jgi:vacuolar-type H+-ATPase subunit H